MKLKQKLVATMAIAFGAAALSLGAAAQEYPVKAIRFIVPFAPGGPTDIMSRALAEKLTAQLGQQIVVDNRGGAGGGIGTALAAHSMPDGYTIVIGHIGTLAINVSLYPRLEYDPVKDFAPISMIATLPLGLFVNANVPVKSVAELVALAKAKPGQLNFGSAGNGSATQMAGAMKFNLTCNRCGGTGRLKNSCPTCRGEGTLSRTDAVEVRIPQGVTSGSRLRVAGKGNAGIAGGAAGDLYITIRVEDHPFFKREGDNINIQVPLTVSEAGLGAKIEVPTIDGRALLKIPQGTQNGQKFRLREKGVFNGKKNTRGDEIVEVKVTVPMPRDEKTKELLRELARLNPDDPRAELWRQV